jgi:quercetin 2,3-dioxygenase
VGPIDPFLFLNHHGPQNYPPKNNGLPFGPHPHRGFETVTFILDGDVVHEDTAGHRSVIREGGVQWMTAGRGLIHSETSSQEFKETGGGLEILQLWLNLPRHLKMTNPRYIGLQREQIPEIVEDSGRVRIRLIAGTWKNKSGPIIGLTETSLMTLDLDPQAQITIPVDEKKNVFFYVIRGNVTVNDQEALSFNLIDFAQTDGIIEVTADTAACILFGHATPFHEPIVAHGPFVMNTKQEILEAISDYQSGRFERLE